MTPELYGYMLKLTKEHEVSLKYLAEPLGTDSNASMASNNLFVSYLGQQWGDGEAVGSSFKKCTGNGQQLCTVP
jgi:hypothetical protein